MATAEWTVLEKLLLSQAVYKYGEDNWFQIARNLKHHALLDRPSDYFNQKNCSLQYYLMVEDLNNSKRHSATQDMPVVVQLARQLYSLRLEELKKAINEDEEKFLSLVSEIDDIRAGKWDDKLLGLSSTTTTTAAAEKASTVESDSNALPSPLNMEDTSANVSNVDKQPEIRDQDQKTSEEQAKVHIDNLKNESRDVRDRDITPAPQALSPKEEEETESESSFQSATEEHMPIEFNTEDANFAKKRLADESMDLEEESSSKRQKTEHAFESVPFDDVAEQSITRTDYSTDVSQVTTPADTTDVGLRDGTESVAESDSNAATPSGEQRRTHKKDDHRHKSWQKNINLLWREIANHKNGAMFMNPIKESIAPHYYEIVKRPMDLKTIKNRIRDGLINSTTEFERDVVLMLNNSLMYNKEGTEVYNLAREMLDDAVEQIKIFKTADTDTAASSHTRAASMAAKERRKSIVPE